MESERIGSNEDNHKAFAAHTGIYLQSRSEIYKIKNNNPDFSVFYLAHYDAEKFSDLEWVVFGGYIANNDHLENINFSFCSLTDAKMALLFRGLAEGGPLKDVVLLINEFGIDGIRSMVPFLKKSRNLRKLDISNNRNINTECFRVLVEAFHAGGTIEKLSHRGAI